MAELFESARNQIRVVILSKRVGIASSALAPCFCQLKPRCPCAGHFFVRHRPWQSIAGAVFRQAARAAGAWPLSLEATHSRRRKAGMSGISLPRSDASPDNTWIEALTVARRDTVAAYQLVDLLEGAHCDPTNFIVR